MLFIVILVISQMISNYSPGARTRRYHFLNALLLDCCWTVTLFRIDIVIIANVNLSLLSADIPVVRAGATGRAALAEFRCLGLGEKSGRTAGCFAELGDCCDRIWEDACDFGEEPPSSTISPSRKGSIARLKMDSFLTLVSTRHFINLKFGNTRQFPIGICHKSLAKNRLVVRKFTSKALNRGVGASRCASTSKSIIVFKQIKMTHSNNLSFPCSFRNAPCTKKTMSPCCPQSQPINPCRAFSTSSVT
jgi:hypothetical protein